MKEIMTKRLVLDPEERLVRKSWGTDWRQMMGDRKRHGMIGILTGNWNGRTVHVEYIPFEHMAGVMLKRVVFTDGTSMEIYMKLHSLSDLLERKIEKRSGYRTLIHEARASARAVFTVTPEKIVPPLNEHPNCRSAMPKIDDCPKCGAKMEVSTGGEGTSFYFCKACEGETAEKSKDPPPAWWMDEKD